MKSIDKKKTDRNKYFSLKYFRSWGFLVCGVVLASVGCGTTKFSDTSRTATEQLLISSAMEEVVDEFDFSPLSGRKVFVNTAVSCTDKDYFVAILRQQLASNGVLLKDTKDDADYILEVAPGTVGTNRYERMYGVPETKVPAVLAGGTSTTIPEMALVKRTDQKAEVKVLLWAYNRTSGQIVWQSGTISKTAYIRDRWFFGAGPFTKSSYEKDIQIAGDSVKIPENFSGEYISKGDEYVSKDDKPSVKAEAIYREIDPKSLERLEAIRKEGLEKLKGDDESATADSEPKETDASADDAKQTSDEKSDSESKTPDASVPPGEATPPAPTATAVSGTPSPNAESRPPENQGNLALPPPPVDSSPNVPAQSAPVLQFGDNLSLPLQTTVKLR